MAKGARVKFWNGLGARIFMLSWLVSILTLVIFVIAIIPEQKRELQDALRSKAQGISSSLHEVTAGGAVSEDFSSVVDQCTQVLAGDEAIDYLVVTRNDGMSVIVQRNSWRTDQLSGFWRPRKRAISWGILTVPVLSRRVFHFAKPFDYSGIEWGWLHVGLSLSAYDRSVQRIYYRTLCIALLCMALSLVISIVYAKRQVRPFLSLQKVVGQLARGDLEARAEIRSATEIESLAGSFNTMADSLLQRNQILEAVRLAAQELLAAPDPRVAIVEILGRLGQAAQATDAVVVEVPSPASPGAGAGTQYIWSGAPSATGSPSDAKKWLWHSGLMPEFAAKLKGGEVVIKQQNPTAAAEECGRLAGVLVPIHAGGEWFGYLGFGDCVGGRCWSEAELDSFRAVAGMFGESVVRQRAQEALIDSKTTLEKRVMERTQELQDLVDARERALEDLADAQRRLIDLSRLSGMAEVATGVLHNVGNVLNSVNVSANLVMEKLAEFRVDRLAGAVALLEKHQEDLNQFVRANEKGQRILPYLGRLSRNLQEERAAALSELRHLQSHIGHIKTIVATQQSYARVSGLIEDVCLSDLVEDALQLVGPSLERHRIHVKRDFAELPLVAADKHQILQILLNLLRNAKEAIKQSDNRSRFIRVSIRSGDEKTVRIEVKDSGTGLAKEDLTRIFAHGFTTKREGHGFGLHSGALAARKMSGSLWAESDGPGFGATFVLELPLARVQKRSVA
jgi:two-component system NtrC family sensor kinase